MKYEKGTLFLHLNFIFSKGVPVIGIGRYHHSHKTLQSGAPSVRSYSAHSYYLTDDKEEGEAEERRSKEKKEGERRRKKEKEVPW